MRHLLELTVFKGTTPPGVPFGDCVFDSSSEFNRACIYISNSHPKKAPPSTRGQMIRVEVRVGMSNIDVSSGSIGLHESKSTESYDVLAFDECYRFIQATKPVKICFAYRGFTSWTEGQRIEFHESVCSKIGVDGADGAVGHIKVSSRWADDLTLSAEKREFQELSLSKVLVLFLSNHFLFVELTPTVFLMSHRLCCKT